MPNAYQSLQDTSTALGVPAAWLRREAQAGRVPSLRAGRRLLFDLADVAAALAARTKAASDNRHVSLPDGGRNHADATT